MKHLIRCGDIYDISELYSSIGEPQDSLRAWQNAFYLAEGIYHPQTGIPSGNVAKVSNTECIIAD